MQEVSVIIPNFNGMAYLDGVLAGLECQTVSNFDVILVDNGSNDGSCAFVAARYPWVHLIELPENFGFCKAVNEGIRASRSPYVLLLNNDIEVTENFIEEMLSAIKRHPKAFSCAARMIQFHDRDRLDDAGNYYCALGWAYARGKGKDIHTYEKEEKIFASCAGAAIYRKKIFDELGYFDEEHFAYLRIQISVIVQEFTAMKTGMRRKQLFIMSAVAQAVHVTISLRQDIHPETISI